MTSNFCTLFDKQYMLYGLGLYQSLCKQKIDFHLYVFAFDDYTASLLARLELPHMTVVTLREFEDEKLLAVKPTRKISEYCWTAASSTILYCLNTFKLDACTYVDADVYFFSSPVPLIEEMGSKSILLTEHRYSPDKQVDTSIRGKYCVQFMTFKNNEDGLRALSWWRERCLEWCYDRVDDGKFGDQKYLDDWTERFPGVHVLQNRGGGIASWNVADYNIVPQSEDLICHNKTTGDQFPIVFYHFHNTTLFNIFGKVAVRGGTENKSAIRYVYSTYSRELSQILHDIRALDPSYKSGLSENSNYYKMVLSNMVPEIIKKSLKKNWALINNINESL